jgi:hypothetical protein
MKASILGAALIAFASLTTSTLARAAIPPLEITGKITIKAKPAKAAAIKVGVFRWNARKIPRRPNASGKVGADHTYTVTLPDPKTYTGYNTLIAWIDLNGNGAVDDGEPCSAILFDGGLNFMTSKGEWFADGYSPSVVQSPHKRDLTIDLPATSEIFATRLSNNIRNVLANRITRFRSYLRGQ